MGLSKTRSNVWGHTRPEVGNFTDFLLKEFLGSLDISEQKPKNVIPKGSLKEYFKRNFLKIA